MPHTPEEFKDAPEVGISRGQAKPRGSRVRVPAGTGAGRPGNTPDPCIPDPCIPESVTRPVLPAMLHTLVAVSFLTVQLSRLHHTHHTPSLARTTAMKAHEGPQQPTKADEEGKGSPQRGKRAQTTRLASFGP